MALLSGIDSTSQLKCWAASIGSGTRSRRRRSHAVNQRANSVNDRSGPVAYQAWASSGNRSASPISIRRRRSRPGCITSARCQRAKSRRSAARSVLSGIAAIRASVSSSVRPTSLVTTSVNRRCLSAKCL